MKQKILILATGFISLAAIMFLSSPEIAQAFELEYPESVSHMPDGESVTLRATGDIYGGIHWQLEPQDTNLGSLNKNSGTEVVFTAADNVQGSLKVKVWEDIAPLDFKYISISIVKVGDIEITPSEAKLKVGESQQFQITGAAFKPFTWGTNPLGKARIEYLSLDNDLAEVTPLVAEDFEIIVYDSTGTVIIKAPVTVTSDEDDGPSGGGTTPGGGTTGGTEEAQCPAERQLPGGGCCPAGQFVDGNRCEFKNPAPGQLVGDRNFADILERIIQILLGFAGVIAIVFLIIGGYQYISSRGSEEGMEQAKRTITAAIIGIIIIIMSFAIVQIVSRLVTTGTG